MCHSVAIVTCMMKDISFINHTKLFFENIKCRKFSVRVVVRARWNIQFAQYKNYYVYVCVCVCLQSLQNQSKPAS